MKKVLIVSTTGMGDCLWGTPSIRALKKTFPKLEVDLLVTSFWKSLFEGNPYIRGILEYHSEWYRQPIMGIQLINKQYDAIFIFHSNKSLKRMLPWFRSTPIWCHQPHLWVPEPNRVKIEGDIHGILTIRGSYYGNNSRVTRCIKHCIDWSYTLRHNIIAGINTDTYAKKIPVTIPHLHFRSSYLNSMTQH